MEDKGYKMNIREDSREYKEILILLLTIISLSLTFAIGVTLGQRFSHHTYVGVIGALVCTIVTLSILTFLIMITAEEEANE